MGGGGGKHICEIVVKTDSVNRFILLDSANMAGLRYTAIRGVCKFWVP